MEKNTTCPLTCEDSPCPVVPMLRTLWEKIDSLSGEVRAIRQTLKNEKPKTKKVSKVAQSHLHVNRLVFALQVEFPDKVWTSDDFAKKIGCTGSAVRQTKEWKKYQERLQAKRQECPKRKGFRNKHGNVEVWDAEKGEDFESKH